ELSISWAAAATRSTASSNASRFAAEGLFIPESFRTNCSAEALTSSEVAGGSKLKSVLMFLHIVRLVCRRGDLGHPRGGNPCRLIESIVFALSRTFQYLVAMVCGIDQMERRIGKIGNGRLKKIELRQSVAGTREKEHRHGHASKVHGPLSARLAGRVKRKAEKDQSLNARQRRFRCCGRGHPAAERMAAGEKLQAGSLCACRLDRRPDSGDTGRIRVSSAALFRVRKIVTEGCNAAAREPLGKRIDERRPHIGTRPVAEDEQLAGLLRHGQHRRNLSLIGRRDKFDLFCLGLQFSSLASRVISAAASTFETGQFSFAAVAIV